VTTFTPPLDAPKLSLYPGHPVFGSRAAMRQQPSHLATTSTLAEHAPNRREVPRLSLCLPLVLAGYLVAEAGSTVAAGHRGSDAQRR
jgi:hypothetical protein